MPTQDVRVTIRVNKQLKESAEALFEYLGLNMSNAVNIFLRKTVDQKGIPFPVNTSSQGIAGLGANEVVKLFNEAVENDIARKKKKGLPIVRYDGKRKHVYLENTDGTKEYV
jgi:DNA-damage-inducible protein J